MNLTPQTTVKWGFARPECHSVKSAISNIIDGGHLGFSSNFPYIAKITI